MPNAGKSIAFRSLSGANVQTHAYYELSTQVASTTFTSGDFISFSATTGTIGMPVTAAATTAATTNGFLGMALANASGTNVTASTAKLIPVALANQDTVFALPFAAGTTTSFATTATAPVVGVSYQIGYGTPSGGVKQFYCDTTTVTATSVLTTTSLVGTVQSVELGGTYARVWVKLSGLNLDNLVR